MFISLLDNFDSVLVELHNTVPVINPPVCSVCSDATHNEGKCVYDILYDTTPLPTDIIDMICVMKNESDVNDKFTHRQRNLMKKCLEQLHISYIGREIETNLDNIIDGSVTMEFLIDKFDNIKNCNCCSRHRIRKPVNITDDSYTWYISDVETERERICKCTCRHNSRTLSECFLQYFA